jgi:hypothetical protein
VHFVFLTKLCWATIWSIFYQTHLVTLVLFNLGSEEASLSPSSEQQPLSACPCSLIDLSYLTGAGLPDGIFPNQKSQFGKILEGLRMENVGIFYGHLVNFTAIWYMLWQFGNVVVIWNVFPHFGFLFQEKSGNPGLEWTST